MHHAPSEKFFSGLGKRSVSHTLSQLSSPRDEFSRGDNEKITNLCGDQRRLWVD